MTTIAIVAFALIGLAALAFTVHSACALHRERRAELDDATDRNERP